MPSTHLSIHLHVIFSTKNREPFIVEAWRDRLHAFLGGALRTAGSVPECIGGTNDHVHLLIGVRATQRLADVMRDIKQASSKWVHQTIGLQNFAWQDGYGAFSVSASQINVVKQYIDRQVEHHQELTFQHEYLAFLKRNEIDYDERYVW